MLALGFLGVFICFGVTIAIQMCISKRKKQNDENEEFLVVPPRFPSPRFETDRPVRPTFEPDGPVRPFRPTFEDDRPLRPTFEDDRPLRPTYNDRPLRTSSYESNTTSNRVVNRSENPELVFEPRRERVSYRNQ